MAQAVKNTKDVNGEQNIHKKSFGQQWSQLYAWLNGHP